MWDSWVCSNHNFARNEYVATPAVSKFAVVMAIRN